jgi:hypothetical protein
VYILLSVHNKCQIKVDEMILVMTIILHNVVKRFQSKQLSAKTTLLLFDLQETFRKQTS